MSDHKESSGMLAYYADLYELGGAVLDKQSYEKHTSVSAQEEQTDDPFSVPQDFNQIAAQAMDAERQAAGKPAETEIITDTVESVEQIQLVPAHTVFRGSGSYRSSGSYRLTSGSYRISSYRSSGSYRMSSNISLNSRPVSSQDLGGYGLHLI